MLRVELRDDAEEEALEDMDTSPEALDDVPELLPKLDLEGGQLDGPFVLVAAETCRDEKLEPFSDSQL